MKFAARCLPLLYVLATAFAYAQLPNFSHIIIIVQENRTPDNIFGSHSSGSGCRVSYAFEPGVDIADSGPSSGNGLTCTVSQPMNDVVGQVPPFDPGHQYLDWVADYDNGAMDGFCHKIDSHGNITYIACPSLTPYSFVVKSDVQPYFDIATAYGFANYMFQTNEGPSFPAHQFLFTGTSAPVAPNDLAGYYLDFVANNAGFNDSGCPYTGPFPAWVQPNESLENDPRGTAASECYPHDTLVTNAAGDKGVSWRYYTPSMGVIWDAPEAIPEVCYGQDYDTTGPCGALEFANHVILPNRNGYSGAPILDDIANCNLQQISWVIPDEAWSDHPFSNVNGPARGPSWVGSIVNAIGQSWTNSKGGGVCDYWGYPVHSGTTPQPTAIFVVWDDWGGFYDHVQPPKVYTSTSPTACTTADAPNGWGCGYVYGFRVPLLVVSAYTQPGYVSGALPTPGKALEYEHDFGSILRFTENNFGLKFIDQSGDNGYADANTLDSANANLPLSDFFSTSNQRNFTQISVPHPPTYFQTYYTTLQNGVYPVPTGPDGTPGEEDY